MKVQHLREIMLKNMQEYLVNKNVHAISHWVSKIHYSDESYTTKDKKEIIILTKLSELNLVKTKTGSVFSVALTEDGIELFKDFEKNGFYGSDTVKRFFSASKK